MATPPPNVIQAARLLLLPQKQLEAGLRSWSQAASQPSVGSRFTSRQPSEQVSWQESREFGCTASAMSSMSTSPSDGGVSFSYQPSST